MWTVRHKNKPQLVADWQALLDSDNPYYQPEHFLEAMPRFIKKWAKKYPPFQQCITRK